MNRIKRKTKSDLKITKVNEFLRMATRSPDAELLRRYFNACSGEDIEPTLTDLERRWVSVNLHGNPGWQKKWQELEKAFGQSVDWQKMGIFVRQKKPAAKKRSVAGLLNLLFPIPAYRYIAMPAILLLVIYGTLHIFSRATLPETHRLASVTGYEEILKVQVRGESPEYDREFVEGIRFLLMAEETWLGLFPDYTQAFVDSALKHLESALQLSRDPFQKAEIAFFLAKGYLMKDDAPRAEEWLHEVLKQEVADYRKETNELLKKIATRRNSN